MNDLGRSLRDPGEDFAGSAADVAARTARRALDVGLVDVAYASADSPLGRLLLAATRRGLVRVAYADEGIDDVLRDLAARVSPRMLEAPARLDPVRRELDEYFDGRRRRFDVSVDWALRGAFVRRVLRVTARIPYGRVASYREVAGRAGSPRAARAAGNALGSNPIPIVVPCHRVVHSRGGLGGYTGGLDRKRHLLRLEGALGTEALR